MKLRGIFIIAVILILGVTFVAYGGSSDSKEVGQVAYGRSSDSIASIKAGEKLFEKLNCYECHTVNGIGYAVGPDLDGFVKDKIKKMGEANYKEWWKRFIKNPPSTKPETPKPFLKKIPSDGECDKIFEFLKSV